ncbi:MAG: response regulator [Clostridia bacterium]|nr:response regulator [Clostridia bacterium]
MNQSDISILIVDDSKTDVAIISSILEGYCLYVAYNGLEAMEIIKNNADIKIVLLDLNMPLMDGFEVLEAIYSELKLDYLNVIILTNYEEVEKEIMGLELGAVDYIRKPLNLQALKKRIEVHYKLQCARYSMERYNADLEEAVALRTAELVMTRDMTIHALLNLLEARDIESSNHTKRTQMMMRALCEHMQKNEKYKDILTDDYISLIYSAAPLHDIGKIGIPDAIIYKPGSLSREEFAVMKKHVEYGVNSIRRPEYRSFSFPFISIAEEIIAAHHEKYDGTGYPDGLCGEEIPLPGRLMAIVDVYDALVNKRVYKPAYTHEEALKVIAGGRGTHFDPGITDAFFGIESTIREIYKKYIGSSDIESWRP